MLNKRKIFILVLSVLIFPFVSVADTYSINEKYYIGFGGGIILPEDVDIKKTGAGVVNGVTISANLAGTLQFDSGYQFSGLIGYRYNEYLSFESELGYTSFDYDQVDVTAAGTATVGGATFTGVASNSYDIDGSISAFSMIFGPVIDFDINNKFEFLIGGGIGFSNYNDEIKSVGGSTGLSYDEDFTNFTTKFKTGINYSFSSKSYIQAEYGYNYVDSGIEDYSDDFGAHSLGGKFILNF